MEITASYQTGWTSLQKITFRFFACLFILYLLPFPFDSAPFINEILSIHSKLSEWYGAVFESYTNLWHAFIPWIGKNIVGVKAPITIFTNGSGDTTYDYVLLLTYFILFLLGCVVWSIVDRKRGSYNQAYYWLRVLVRYYLASAMMGYGFAKVFHLQMPFPYLSQLVQPFGDKSPMGLAWSFIGYSKGYSAFTGWSEVIGGVLLLFRRTTTLGALIVAIVMLNIAAINYAYDVPVKLYSSMLFMMAAFLMAIDFRKLVDVLILHKPVPASGFPLMLHSRRLKITRGILKGLFIASLLYSNISGSISAMKNYGDNRKLPSLYGIYNIETVIRNNDTLAPLATDSTRWKQLIIQFDKFAQVKMTNDSIRRFNFIVNDSLKNVIIYTNADTLNKSTLHYELDSTGLILSGRMNKDSIYMQMRKYDIKNFRLVNRGYNWINEYPFNR